MLKQVLLWTFGTFVLIQAIQIEIPEIPVNIDPKKEIQVPDTIASLFKTSCYDCHSYQTTLPWYGNVAPVSWEVRSHIKDGRAWVNFQEWGNYDEKRKQKIYKGIVKSINLRMPIPMYINMHEGTDLTTKQRREIKAWAKSHIVEE